MAWDAKECCYAAGTLLDLVRDPEIRSGFWLSVIGEKIPAAQEAQYQDWSRQARWIFIRGFLYPACLALVFLIRQNAFLVIQFIQAILVCLTLFLTFLIAWRLWGLSLAVVSLIVGSIYPAWAIVSGFILPEALCVFLVTLLCFLLMGRASVKRSLGIGLLCGALILTKPTFISFTLFAIAAFLVMHLKRLTTKKVFLFLSILLLGIVILVGPLFISATIYYGKPALYQSGFWYWAFYQHNCLEDDGCVTLAALPAITPSLLSVTKQRGYSLNEWPQDGEVPEDVYFWTTLRSMLRRPLDHLVLAARKLFRAWSRPWNEFRLTTILPYSLQVIIHRAIILLAVVGVPLSFQVFPLNLAIILPVLFCSLYYPFTISQSRYNVMAMPAMIILCAWTIVTLPQILSNLKKNIRLCLVISATLCAIIVVNSLTIGDMLTLMQSPVSALHVLRLLRALAFIGLALILYSFYAPLQQKLFRFISSILLPTILVAQILISPYGREKWHEWKCTFFDPTQKIRQIIKVPPRVTKDVASASLLFDLTGCSELPPLVIRVNDQIIKEFPYGPPLKERAHRYVWTDAYRYPLPHPERLREWLYVPIEPELLEGQENIAIEVGIRNHIKGKGSCYSIWGDYTLPGAERAFRGPSLMENDYDLSIEKWERTGDIRMERSTPLQYEECRSYLNRGDGWSESDLSPERGIQTGQYRIRIMLKDKQGKTTFL